MPFVTARPDAEAQRRGVQAGAQRREAMLAPLRMPASAIGTPQGGAANILGGALMGGPKLSTETVSPRPEPHDPFANAKIRARGDAKDSQARNGTGKQKMYDRHVAVKSGQEGVSASANEVQAVHYNRNIGKSGENRGFFKGFATDTKSDQAYAARIGVHKGTDARGREDWLADADPRLGARAVASSRLDRALGTNVLSEEVFARHGNKKGTASARVAGNQFQNTVLNERGQIQSQTVDTSVDLSHPETQKGFSDLQMMDFLTGQVDRHQGNIFVDGKSGKVSGIDNDLAFGRDDKNLNGLPNNYGLPSMVDATTASSLSKMTDKQFLKAIGGRRGDYQKLDKDEKAGALDRLHQAQAHVKSLADKDDGSIVSEWNQDTFHRQTSDLYGENGQFDDRKVRNFRYKEQGLLARSVLDQERTRRG